MFTIKPCSKYMISRRYNGNIKIMLLSFKSVANYIVSYYRYSCSVKVLPLHFGQFLAGNYDGQV